MSQKAKNENKAPTIRRVSGRDQEIYQQTAIEGQSQRKVAAEKKISQARISKIVKRVGLWLSETIPYGFAELPREQRLNMGARMHRMKLQWMYEQATEAWQESKKSLHTRKEKIVKGEKVEEHSVKTQSGNFRLLDGACKIAERQIVFDGFALDGKVEVSCEGRLFEQPALTEDEMLARMSTDYKRLRPVLEDWERKQGKEESGGEGEGVNHFATSLATCSAGEETENPVKEEIDECRVMNAECGRNAEEVSEVLAEVLSDISMNPRQEDVTSIAVSVNDAFESLVEVLSAAAMDPPAHVASDMAKSSPPASAIANHQTSIPPVFVARSPEEHVASDAATCSGSEETREVGNPGKEEIDECRVMSAGCGSNSGDVSEVLAEVLSDISMNPRQEDVTSIAVSVNDAFESLVEVLSAAAMDPPAHVASDMAKSSPPASAIANHQSSIPPVFVARSPEEHVASDAAKWEQPERNPQLTYQTPLPRYHEADGVRRPMPYQRIDENPARKKLPGLWLKHPATYVRSESTGEWVPSG